MTVDVDLTHYAILFGAIVVGYVLAGAIDARLQRRHPAWHAELGTLIDSRPLNRDTFPRLLRWLSFLSLHHFRLRDPVLSVLCFLNVGLGVSLVAYLFLNS